MSNTVVRLLAQHLHGAHFMRLITVLALTAFATSVAEAQVPRLVRYGSVVRDAAGAPRTGPARLTMAIYAEAESGAPLWMERQDVTLDAAGRYAILLGATIPEGLPMELFAGGDARWLGVSVDGGAEGPRVALVSVPYALKSGDADTLGGRPLSEFVLAGDKTAIGDDGQAYVDKKALSKGTANFELAAVSGIPGYLPVFTGTDELGNSAIFQSGSNIGVGTTAPAAAFNVAATSAPGAFFDVYSNVLGALPAVYRAARGTPFAPLPVQTNDILGGLAVRGYAPSGFTEGKGQIMFKAAENWTNTANGTYLQLTTTPIGSSAFVERIRIDPFGNVGIGTSNPAFRLDVAGPARFATGTSLIGLGGGMGISLFIGAGDSTGLSVANTATEGTGVFSEAQGVDGIGVFGSAFASATGIAIAGYQPSLQGWAGYFDGDVGVTGFLFKGGGAFKIDHPLDPENKYLSHSFVESPDMKNIYDGVVVLNESGEATISMPDWFEALNQDFRYQLTPIGASFAPYIAEEITGNQFKIAGGVPGKKVSWQVTGIRHDAFANANRLTVEQFKPDDAVGTYLHPEAFGLTVEENIHSATAKSQKTAEQKAKEYKARVRAISRKPIR